MDRKLIQLNWSSNIALLILQEILQSHCFLMSRNFKTQGCQWYGIKRIKSIFADKSSGRARFLGTFSLPQVVLISSIKPILSSASLSTLGLDVWTIMRSGCN